MPTVFQPSSGEVVQFDSRNLVPSQPQPRVEWSHVLTRLAMICCLYSIPVLATVHGAVDYDAWWHLRVGQWVVEHRAVPQNDPCSSFGHDKPWVAYSWLFEVILYGFHQCFGLGGIVFFRLLLCLGVTALLHRFIAKREPRFLYATGLTCAATLAIALLFKERPWLFTILCSCLTLDVILDLRNGKRTRLVWVLPLVFVVWVNVHIQFVYGLMFLFIACAAPALEHWFGRRESGRTAATLRTPGWWQLVAVSGACFLATFLSPYHAELYRVVVEYATQPGPFRYLNELKALDFREPCDWVMLVLAALACFALGRRQSVSFFDVILLAFSGWLAFRSCRDMWLLVLTSVYLLTARPRKPADAGEAFRLTLPHVAVVAAGVVFLTVATFLIRDLSNESMRDEVAKTFPVKAAAFVAEKGYAGPLYNDFNWGGYLIWALPQLPVAIDGRTNLHGDARIEHFGNVWAGLPDAAEDEELLKASVIIAPATSPRASLLLRDPQRFQEVYKDDLARVFIRK